MSLYEMSTLATGLFGLRSTFRAAFAGLKSIHDSKVKAGINCNPDC